MKVTIEWSKEELEKMIRERLAEAGFAPTDENAIHWKNKPKFHIVVEAVAVPITEKPPASVLPRGAPRPSEGFQGDGKLPANMFPEGASLDALQEAAAEEDTLAAAANAQVVLRPGETKGDPRGENEQ